MCVSLQCTFSSLAVSVSPLPSQEKKGSCPLKIDERTVRQVAEPLSVTSHLTDIIVSSRSRFLSRDPFLPPCVSLPERHRDPETKTAAIVRFSIWRGDLLEKSE